MMRGLIFLALLTLSDTPARAQVLTLGSWGSWAAFGGAQPDGQRICGIAVRADDRALHILYRAGQRDLRIELTKRSWQIPQRVPVALNLRAGGEATPSLAGEGLPRSGREPPMLVVAMPYDASARFWQGLRTGSTLQVRFATGNERPWTLPAEASTAAVDALEGCLRRMGAPTAPVEDQAATRPFDGAPRRR